ncbi:MAG: ABC transporter permease [Firmicutes bacterium]|nr:ABC transporter permease [Bacillota bacterium]
MAEKTAVNRKPSVFVSGGEFFRKYSLYLVFALLLFISGLVSPAFFNFFNLMNLLRQTSFIGLIAIGMTFVVLTGGIDLSVGANYAFSAMLLAYLFHFGMYKGYVESLTPFLPSPFIFAIALLAGAAIGAMNGFLVAGFRLAPFIVTMGTMVIFRGLAYNLAGGRTIFGIGQDLAFLGTGMIGRIPVPAVIWAAVAFLSWMALTFTRFGRRIYAVGGDEEAARLSGIKVNRYKFMVYVISGVLAALAGVMMVARADQAEPRMGELFELDAIAAVVIGGSSLFGGVGTIPGTIIGCLILAIITNLLNLLGVHPYPQQIIKGGIILGGILLQNFVQRGRRSGKG